MTSRRITRPTRTTTTKDEASVQQVAANYMAPGWHNIPMLASPRPRHRPMAPLPQEQNPLLPYHHGYQGYVPSSSVSLRYSETCLPNSMGLDSGTYLSTRLERQKREEHFATLVRQHEAKFEEMEAGASALMDLGKTSSAPTPLRAEAPASTHLIQAGVESVGTIDLPTAESSTPWHKSLTYDQAYVQVCVAAGHMNNSLIGQILAHVTRKPLDRGARMAWARVNGVRQTFLDTDEIPDFHAGQGTWEEKILDLMREDNREELAKKKTWQRVTQQNREDAARELMRTGRNILLDMRGKGNVVEEDLRGDGNEEANEEANEEVVASEDQPEAQKKNNHKEKKKKKKKAVASPIPSDPVSSPVSSPVIPAAGPSSNNDNNINETLSQKSEKSDEPQAAASVNGKRTKKRTQKAMEVEENAKEVSEALKRPRRTRATQRASVA
ncbi:hypothetical protein K504DRAFT_456401 [Pleomassaria siparia CBS 279.74]|uniref:Uncharacterized protein n=1 Tax=Pleomassaria siparia CBS 279.74 TaxID=1314801 RepID=A0A6G1K7P9_9PLEO|nr:hypothetical protein K504DRAFT_456401 [Pleomassaria siparia CBS 279.74]